MALTTEWSFSDLQMSSTASMDNDTNGTSDGGQEQPNSALKAAHDYMAVVILVLIMLAMGSHITWAQIWEHLRRPVGLVIGMGCQFLFMPLAGFCLIKALGLSGYLAIGMLVTSCSAGGVTSNMFTYFADGDVPLSITMTVASTVVALGMMPLNMWMYGQALEADNVVIPYVKIILSLVSVTCPVGVGMLIKWKLPKLAPYVTKAGSWAGVLFIIVAQTLEMFLFPDLFNGIPGTLYAAVVLLPVLGVTAGYLISWALKRPPAVRKTVAIESGVQNIGIAITVVTLSFDFKTLKKVLPFPWLYAFTMTGVCVIIAVSYQIYKRFVAKEEPAAEGADIQKNANEATHKNDSSAIKGEDNYGLRLEEKV